MATRSRDFVGVAEGIKSHEISTKGRIEQLKGRISELSSQKVPLTGEYLILNPLLQRHMKILMKMANLITL